VIRKAYRRDFEENHSGPASLYKMHLSRDGEEETMVCGLGTRSGYYRVVSTPA
jgi:hypothetical protein